MLTSQLGRLPFSAEPSSSSASSSRGGIASGQRFWSASNSRQGSQSQWPSRSLHGRLALQAAAILAEVEPRNLNSNSRRKDQAPELQASCVVIMRPSGFCVVAGQSPIELAPAPCHFLIADFPRLSRGKWQSPCSIIPSRRPKPSSRPPRTRHH